MWQKSQSSECIKALTDFGFVVVDVFSFFFFFFRCLCWIPKSNLYTRPNERDTRLITMMYCLPSGDWTKWKMCKRYPLNYLNVISESIVVVRGPLSRGFDLVASGCTIQCQTPSTHIHTCVLRIISARMQFPMSTRRQWKFECRGCECVVFDWRICDAVGSWWLVKRRNGFICVATEWICLQ